MQSINLETDCQVLANALQSDEYDLAPGGVLFREAKFFISTHFNSVNISYAPRSCNSCAHELVRFGRSRDSNEPINWIDDPFREFVNRLVVRDMTEPWVNE